MPNPPSTGNTQLDAYLRSVKDALNTAVKPVAGWKLSDFSADVSEVISDKRDLIDIVTAWDDITQVKAEFDAEIARYEDLYADSKVLGEQHQDYAETFSGIMEWWDQNVQLIESVEFFMTQVQNSESAAIQSAADAKASETKAKSSETKAKTSETNSKSSETNSKASETAAAESETAAAGSATSAASSASNAAGSATAASGSASAAATSAANAKTSETNANSSKGAAATSASNAAGSASAAASSASQALGYKNDMGTAISNATDTVRGEFTSLTTRSESAASRAETAEAGAAAAAVVEVNKLKAGAPAAFDTLLEIANELEANETERASLANSIGLKADKTYVDTEVSKKANSSHQHPVTDITATGTRSATTYLRGDGSWTTPTNTTYSVPTQAEAEAGTASTGRAFSAQRVAQAIAALAAPKVHTHTAAETGASPVGHKHVADDLTDATTIGKAVLKAASAAAARSAIGAGTSDLTLGTTASTAKAGNWAPTWNEVADKPGDFPPSPHEHVLGDLPIEFVSVMPDPYDPNVMYFVEES